MWGVVMRQDVPAGNPGAVRIVNAEADEAQCGFGQNGRRDAERQGYEDRAEDIGKNMAPDNSPARSAHGSCALHEEKLLGLQNLSARDARKADPRHETDGEEQSKDVSPQ